MELNNNYTSKSLSSKSYSKLQEFYKNKNILITGANGFTGKMLIEKLLRSCDVSRIYLLIKLADDERLEERETDIRGNKIFRYLEVNKISCVNGDVSRVGLGLSRVDQQLIINNVEIIFHCASTTGENKNIRKSILLNVRGTRELINIACRMKKLEAFVHQSSVFVNQDENCLFESIHPSVDHNELIELCEVHGDEVSSYIKQRYLGKAANPFSFSKSIAENVINDVRELIPVCIVRPGLVCSTAREPYPGLMGNRNGLMAILSGASCGLVRTLNVDPDSTVNFVPVDMVVNVMIAAAWRTTIISMDAPLQIYNCKLSLNERVTWDSLIKLVNKLNLSQPARNIVLYPKITIVQTNILYKIHFVLFQLIPSLLLDLFYLCRNKKAWLTKYQIKLYKYLDRSRVYLLHRRDIKTSNVQKLSESMSEFDRQEFCCDFSNDNRTSYLTMWITATLSSVGLHEVNSKSSDNSKNKLKWISRGRKVSIVLLFASAALLAWSLF